jgi:hypothetical protein
MARIHFNNLTSVGFEELSFELLRRLGFKEPHKIRSLQQIRRAENEYFDKICTGEAE